MKFFKILPALTLACAMTLTLAACGGSASSSSTAPETRYVEGTIMDATMNTITIGTADGLELTFGTEDADMSEAEGLEIGSMVEIHYTGTINGTDTSGVTVTRVVQHGYESSSAAPVSSSSQVPAPAGNTEHSVSGTITYSDGATLTIETYAKVTLSFNVVGADATGANGLAEGDDVTVYYTGNLAGSDTSGVTVTRLVQDIPAPAANVEQSVFGTITYCDGATLTMTTPSGQTLSFLIAGADANNANGLVEGSDVTVYYTGTIHGDDTSQVTVTKLVQ